MPVSPQIVKCYKFIDSQRKRYVDELRDIVALPGISGKQRSHKKISLLIDWMKERLKSLGFDVELREMGSYKSPETNAMVDVPLLILGSLGKDSEKKNLLYYCHLDVADVDLKRWTTDPFEMIERDGKLYGRGTAKMKGPLLCFIHAIECYKALGIPLPVNVKIFCESMNEAGSVGVCTSLNAIKTKFLRGIDCILMNDGQWIGKDYPCIIHGFRGVCYFDVSISGPKIDLPSGEFGGIIFEPMQDLLFLLNTLVDYSGNIKIPGFYDDVMLVTPEEESIYRKLKIDIDDFRRTAGVKKLSHDGIMKKILMHVWRYPNYNLHYINSNLNCDCSIKLTIPKKVTARFSLRLVPRQSPERVCNLLHEYVQKKMRERCTPNIVTVGNSNHLDPWIEDHMHWNYEAAKIAIKQVYKEEANLIRQGNEFSTLLQFRQVLPGKNILVLPLVNCESGIQKEDENISLKCYIECTKLITNYLHQLSVSSHKH